MTRKNILFFISHQPNPRFIKQINFLAKNNNIFLLYFHRDYMKDLSSEYKSVCIFSKSIANLSNGNYVQRIFQYFKSIQIIRNILKNRKIDIVLVNNFDVLLLFKTARIFENQGEKIVIEISDLLPHHFTKGIKSSVLQLVENLSFKLINKLIVTSPKFYELYYKKIFFDEYFILENKPLSNMIPIKVEKNKNEKTVIGIVGLLLQGEPYKTLFETVKNNNKFEVHIYGKGSYQSLVESYAEKYANIKFFGEYNFFKDSSKIYSSLDLIYMPYNTKDVNQAFNNKIALPNKLYEAMYFEVPIITSDETYLGEIVENYGIGISIKCCDKVKLLKSLETINIDSYKENFKLLNPNLYLADNDYVKLEEYLCL